MVPISTWPRTSGALRGNGGTNQRLLLDLHQKGMKRGGPPTFGRVVDSGERGEGSPGDGDLLGRP